jgi:bifunctional DNA-binding transcriptional regulator/antitoxin component of YhaV-PrlF toxin-antitoxin module
MPRHTVVMGRQGRIQLPEEVRQSMGWSDRQWYVIEDADDAILIKTAAGPRAAEAIRDVFSRRLLPLGEGRGKGHTQYVSRWRHGSGVAVVSENGQPNIWVTKATAARFASGAVPGPAQLFEPGIDNPGFHSNVASTPGFRGNPVVKFRADDAVAARRLAEAIVDKLENVK